MLVHMLLMIPAMLLGLPVHDNYITHKVPIANAYRSANPMRRRAVVGGSKQEALNMVAITGWFALMAIEIACNQIVNGMNPVQATLYAIVLGYVLMKWTADDAEWFQASLFMILTSGVYVELLTGFGANSEVPVRWIYVLCHAMVTVVCLATYKDTIAKIARNKVMLIVNCIAMLWYLLSWWCPIYLEIGTWLSLSSAFLLPNVLIRIKNYKLRNVLASLAAIAVIAKMAFLFN